MEQIDILPIGDNCVKIHRKGIVNQIVLVVPVFENSPNNSERILAYEYYWKWFEGDPTDRRIGKDKAILLVGDEALKRAIDIFITKISLANVPGSDTFRDFSNPEDKKNHKKYEFIEKEIKLLLRFLRMIENLMSDIMLEDIIVDPSCGLELFWKHDKRDDNHLTCNQLISALASKDEILNQNKNNIIQQLSIREHLIEMKSRMGSVYMLVSKTIELTGITSHLLAECNYNGLLLLENLVDVSKVSTSLSEFIVYLEEETGVPSELDLSMFGSP